MKSFAIICKNYDRMTDRQLAVLASEIYHNYSTNYSIS